VPATVTPVVVVMTASVVMVAPVLNAVPANAQMTVANVVMSAPALAHANVVLLVAAIN